MKSFELNIKGNLLAVSLSESCSEKPVIIFLHDSLGCMKLWRDFPQRLAEKTGCNIMVYDRQGYGSSAPFNTVRTKDYLEKEADILNEVFEKCGITQAILFGHSDGGSIALIAASKYPEKIKAIITEGAHVFVEEITLAGIRESKELYRTTNLREKLMKYHGDKTEAIFQAWTETWLSESFRDWNIEKFLPDIKCPVLVIQGEKDEYGTVKQIESIVSNSSGKTEMYLVPETGHTPHKEAPDQVLTGTAQFITELLKTV